MNDDLILSFRMINYKFKYKNWSLSLKLLKIIFLSYQSNKKSFLTEKEVKVEKLVFWAIWKHYSFSLKNTLWYANGCVLLIDQFKKEIFWGSRLVLGFGFKEVWKGSLLLSNTFSSTSLKIPTENVWPALRLEYGVAGWVVLS